MPIHEPLICRLDGQLGETDGFRCRSSEEERSQEAGQADCKPTKRPTVQCGERTPPPAPPSPRLQGQPRHQLTPRCTMEKEREPPMAASLSFLSPSAGGDDVALPSRPNTTSAAAAAACRRRRRRRRRHYVASLELEHAVHAKHLYSEDIFRRRRRRHDRSRPLPSSMGQSGAGARSVGGAKPLLR